MSEGFNKLKKDLGAGLEKKRWSAKSVIALLVFGAIILVFALFGLPNKMNGGSSGMSSAASVNHSLIPLNDLRSESQRMEQMYAPLFGGKEMGDAQRQFVRQQALENLISQELVSQSAAKAGILATDAEIQDMIVRELPYFQRDGRFQRDLYYQILEANRLTPHEFESKLRKERVNVRAQRLFEAASNPLNVELEKLKALQENKLNVAFVRFDRDLVASKMKVSDSEVAAKLAQPEFAKKVEEYYKANQAEFSVQPQVRAQHILIKIDAQKDQAKAKAQIDDLKKKSEKEDFAKLASQFSEDQGSKTKGGDLGYFGKGQMVPEFEVAAFNQKVGQVGEVIRTPFGYHLIKVLDRKEAQQKSFEQVKSEIARKTMASEVYDSELKSLEEALARGNSTAVETQLKKMGMTWDETGFFDLSAESVPKLSSAEASRAAFSLTEAKPWYPQVVREGNEKFVLKLKASKKEAATSVANLQQTLERERSSDLFRAWIEEAKKTARIERNMEAVKGR